MRKKRGRKNKKEDNANNKEAIYPTRSHRSLSRKYELYAYDFYHIVVAKYLDVIFPFRQNDEGKGEK